MLLRSAKSLRLTSCSREVAFDGNVGANIALKCDAGRGPGLGATQTWWRDSNPRALLCRQLPGLSGTPRANDTRRLAAAGSKFMSQAFAALRR